MGVFQIGGKVDLIHHPLNLESASLFVKKHHRHSKPLKRHKFTIGAWEGYNRSHYFFDWCLGIVTVDNCSSALTKHRDHIEFRRVCIHPKASHLNVASFLMGKAMNSVYSMGYRVIITYTKPYESGASLKACGFFIQDVNFKRNLVRWVASSTDRQPCLKRTNAILEILKPLREKKDEIL